MAPRSDDLPMTAHADGRSPVRPALTLIGALAAAVVVAELGMAAENGWLWAAALSAGVGIVHVAAGLLAWDRRPSNGMGRLLVFGGFAVFAGNLTLTTEPILLAVGTVVASVPLAVVVHLLLAFPSGRLVRRLPRTLVAVGYGVCLLLEAPRYLFAAGHPLAVADLPWLAGLAHPVQATVGISLLVVTAGVLVGRWRRARPAQRRVLGPLYAYGVGVVPLIPVLAHLGLPVEVVSAAQLILLLGLPVAFALAVLRGGFARTGEVEELGQWLGASGGARPELAGALARALGDPSLRLLFWTDRGEYVDAAGRPVEPPADRGAVEVDVAGRRVGLISYDAALLADPHDVRVAGRVVALAVDRERLIAELRASTEALQVSRARIVEAGDRERRDLGRDLHDGLQVRLVLLAMQAQQLSGDPAGGAALRRGIDEAAAELRDLVHSVMPPALVERGLSAAVEDLVDRVPLATTVELGVVDGALAPVWESTAYFVVAEALTNALKHSAASTVDVRVVAADGLLIVEVSDDGVGGVGGTQERGGSGLRGLADRVESLGGRFTVDGPAGGGTRVRAELPCG